MSKDHMIRMAGRIHRQLSQPNIADADWSRAVSELVARLRTIQRQWELSQVACQRGWPAAAASQNQQILAEAARLEAAASHLRYQRLPDPIECVPPLLGTLVAELQQLGNEFDDVEIDLKHGLIGVTTDPIVLEGIDLGPFTIELHVSRLADRLGSECFGCVALEPNPAASNDSTVHPHVQDGHLCAGDASVPISAALKDGRIADAFVLIRSVLQNYNPDSPYVSLENWSGRDCGECGYLADGDNMHCCEDCEKDVCEECYCSCEMCDHCCCRSCLETDPVSGNRCCCACRHTCAQCDRTVDHDSFDEETELCPSCLAKQRANQEQENEHESPALSDDPPAPDHATLTTADAPPTPTQVPAAA